MRHTVSVDDALLKEARRVLGTESIRATIELALREAIRKRRLEEFRRALGTFELDLTAEDLERLRSEG